MSLQAGQIVNVFDNPIDCTEFVGRAELIRQTDLFSILEAVAEFWWVRFENGDGRECWVNKTTH